MCSGQIFSAGCDLFWSHLTKLNQTQCSAILTPFPYHSYSLRCKCIYYMQTQKLNWCRLHSHLFLTCKVQVELLLRNLWESFLYKINLKFDFGYFCFHLFYIFLCFQIEKQLWTLHAMCYWLRKSYVNGKFLEKDIIIITCHASLTKDHGNVKFWIVIGMPYVIHKENLIMPNFWII